MGRSTARATRCCTGAWRSRSSSTRRAMPRPGKRPRRACSARPARREDGRTGHGHPHETPAALLSVAPQLPLAVTPIVDRAISKQPDERFATMHEVIAALEPLAAPLVPAWASSNPLALAPPSRPRPVDPFAQTQAGHETGKGVASDRARTTARPRQAPGVHGASRSGRLSPLPASPPSPIHPPPLVLRYVEAMGRARCVTMPPGGRYRELVAILRGSPMVETRTTDRAWLKTAVLHHLAQQVVRRPGPKARAPLSWGCRALLTLPSGAAGAAFVRAAARVRIGRDCRDRS